MEETVLGASDNTLEQNRMQIHPEYRDHHSGAVNREVPYHCNPSTAAKCSSYSDDQPYKSMRDNTVKHCTSSSSSDDDEITASDDSDLEDPQRPAGIKFCVFGESVTCEMNENVCNAQNTSEVVRKQQSHKMDGNNAMWQEPSRDADFAIGHRNATVMETVGQIIKKKVMPENQTTDNKNDCPVRWKNPPLEKPLPVQKESSDYFVERTTDISRRGIHVDDNVPQMQRCGRDDSDSFVKWKVSSTKEILPRRNEASSKTGKLYWVGGETPFKSSYEFITKANADQKLFSQGRDSKFGHFSQTACDKKRGANNYGNHCQSDTLKQQNDAGEYYSTEQDCKSSQCNKRKFVSGNDFETEVEAWGTERGKYGGAPVEADHLVSLKSCGQNVRIRQRDYQVREREIIFGSGRQDEQITKQVLYSNIDEELESLDETAQRIYSNHEVRGRQDHLAAQKLYEESSSAHSDGHRNDVSFQVNSDTRRMTQVDNECLGMKPSYDKHQNSNDFSERRNFREMSQGNHGRYGNQQRNSQHRKHASCTKRGHRLGSAKSCEQNESPPCCNVAPEGDFGFHVKSQRMPKENKHSDQMKPGYHQLGNFNGGKQLSPKNNHSDRMKPGYHQLGNFNDGKQLSPENNYSDRMKPGYHQLGNFSDDGKQLSPENRVQQQEDLKRYDKEKPLRREKRFDMPDLLGKHTSACSQVHGDHIGCQFNGCVGVTCGGCEYAKYNDLIDTRSFEHTTQENQKSIRDQQRGLHYCEESSSEVPNGPMQCQTPNDHHRRAVSNGSPGHQTVNSRHSWENEVPDVSSGCQTTTHHQKCENKVPNISPGRQTTNNRCGCENNIPNRFPGHQTKNDHPRRENEVPNKLPWHQTRNVHPRHYNEVTNRPLVPRATIDHRRWASEEQRGREELDSRSDPVCGPVNKATANRNEDRQNTSVQGKQNYEHLCENLEKLAVVLENEASSSGERAAGAEGGTSSQRTLCDIKSMHEKEMLAAQNTAVALLKNFGNKLSESVVSSHMLLQIFRVIYKEWVTARNETLKMLEALDVKVQGENWQATFNTFCDYVKTAADWTAEILKLTPYANATKVVQVVPPLVEKARELINSRKQNEKEDPRTDNVLQILQRDIQLCTELGVFAHQCEMQFKETVKLFVEFRDMVLLEQMVDFVEDMGLVNFIIDLPNSDPTSDEFFQQMSASFQNFHNSREDGSTNAQAFCSFIDDDPAMLDTIKCMCWHFTQSFQNQPTENVLNKCWQAISGLVYNITDRSTDASKIIAGIISILKTQKSEVKKNVSSLF